MHRHWSIAVTLVLALALGVPAAACCEAALSDTRTDGAELPADAPAPPPPPPCHPPMSEPVPVAPEPADTPCDDRQCECDRSTLTACHRILADDARAIPSAPSTDLLDALLHATVVQPQTLLPHTFFDWHHADEDAALRPDPARTLLSLSCQLTL